MTVRRGPTEIPHESPNRDRPTEQEGDFIYRLDYPKDANQTWYTFHPSSSIQALSPPSDASQSSRYHWKTVVAIIRDHHTRFAEHNAVTRNPRCSSPDRRTVLSLYREALTKLENVDEITARKIHLEVVKKVETILDLRDTLPEDNVFYIRGAFLAPLEPQYASPRAKFYDRGDGEGDDAYFYTGYARLWEWRQEGWPKAVPWKAIEREKKARKERRKNGCEMLSETVGEGLMKAFDSAAEKLYWGDEVDADPRRPWA